MADIQMNPNGDEIPNAAAKAVTLWTLVGITSWADAASFFAALYSMILLGEWVWKRLVRPFCERRGWIKSGRP